MGAGASSKRPAAARQPAPTAPPLVAEERSPMVDQRPPVLEGEQRVRVIVPQNMSSGQEAQFTVNGRQLRARVPEGVTPGQAFDVRVPLGLRLSPDSPGSPSSEYDAGPGSEYDAMVTTQLSALSAIREMFGEDTYTEERIFEELAATEFDVERTIAALVDAASGTAMIKAELAELSQDSQEKIAQSHLQVFDATDLRNATEGYSKSREIGSGGFGHVYKGTIAAIGHVAVKKLDDTSMQGGKEFASEVEFLSQLVHPNLIALFGYSVEGAERCLVYELALGGSLETRLESPSALGWPTRVQVAIDVARGLHYLHSQSTTGGPFVHGDIKTSNILLSEPPNLVAKLSDFGLGRYDSKEVSQTRSVKGSWGYIDPEYARTGRTAPSTDIFAFGVVLLELLTLQKAVDQKRTPPDLASYAAKSDFDVKKIIAKDSWRQLASVFAEIARDCLHESSDLSRLSSESLLASLLSLRETLRVGAIAAIAQPVDDDDDAPSSPGDHVKNFSSGTTGGKSRYVSQFAALLADSK